jgi:cellulose synthase/poly-beta-1,6-N-acetylglucosamine synthase-like glycosyltransferase
MTEMVTVVNDMETFDVFRTTTDYEPTLGSSYFVKDKKPSENFDMISILIPMYNESEVELKRTLLDLYKCIVEMNKIGGGCINTLIVLDGWKVTHPTMKSYLKEMFPGVSEQIEDIGNTENSVETYIIQKEDKDGLTYVKISDGKFLKLSILVKLDNRRKHNSHAWFLEGYAQEMNADYVFLTDCGTKFQRKCLINLYRGIRDDKSCSAISGRQRVMTTEQQEMSDGLRGYLYRSMQCFDYEVSLACFVGAFSTFGMLPVIPGPCGFYRLDAICNKESRRILRNHYDNTMVEIPIANNDSVSISIKPELKYINLCGNDYIDAIDFYIKTVSVNPDESGMLMGCLLLAEDRVLSYAATLVTDKTYHTKYEPKACFYFEAETDPVQLLQQRRRWINGTVAGYVWLLSKISILFKSKMKLYEKIFLTILLFAQLMMFVIIAIGIPIMTIGIRYNAMKLFDFKSLYIEGFIVVYVLLYVVFVFTHSSPKSKIKLNVFLFDIITLVNMLVVGLLATCIGMYVWNREFTINLILILFNIAMPFFLAFLHDWKSLALMFKCIIPFMLLLPTFTIYFCVYGFSRLWELTWGNRPSNKLITLETTLNDTEREDIKRKQQSQAQSIAWALVATNVLLCFFFYSFQFNNVFIIGLQGFLFIWAFLQMIMSFAYFITYDFRQGITYIYRLITCRLNRKLTELNDKFGKRNEEYKKIIRSIDASMRGYKI